MCSAGYCDVFYHGVGNADPTRGGVGFGKRCLATSRHRHCFCYTNCDSISFGVDLDVIRLDACSFGEIYLVWEARFDLSLSRRI